MVAKGLLLVPELESTPFVATNHVDAEAENNCRKKTADAKNFPKSFGLGMANDFGCMGTGMIHPTTAKAIYNVPNVKMSNFPQKTNLPHCDACLILFCLWQAS